MTEQLFLDRWNEPDYIARLSDDKELIGAFSLLSNCSIEIIKQALSSRRTTGEIISLGSDTEIERSAIFEGGYNIFQVPKSDGSFRTISEPAPALKSVQSEIKDSLLSQIGVSCATFGGEKGRSYIDNAIFHKDNTPRYMVNLDLSNAFPSVATRRLFNNLKSALKRKIDISLPGISEDERNKLIDLLVIFMTYNNELPQGAPTSPKALNIVLGKIDQRIADFVRNKAGLKDARYSRYVDDITVSWKEFQDMMPVWEIRGKILQFLDSIFQRNTELDSETIHSDIERVSKYLDELDKIQFTINSRKQRGAIIELLVRIQEMLDSYNIFVHSGSNEGLVKKLDTVKGKIRNYRYGIEQSSVGNQIEGVAEGIRKILIHEGWRVNDDKTRINTPASKKQMVVTGVSIDKQGRLGVPQENENKIRKFLERAIQLPHTLPMDCRGNNKKISEKILGYRNYIISVRGKINSDLSRLFREAKKIYFPDMGESEMSRYRINYGDL